MSLLGLPIASLSFVLTTPSYMEGPYQMSSIPYVPSTRTNVRTKKDLIGFPSPHSVVPTYNPAPIEGRYWFSLPSSVLHTFHWSYHKGPYWEFSTLSVHPIY